MDAQNEQDNEEQAQDGINVDCSQEVREFDGNFREGGERNIFLHRYSVCKMHNCIKPCVPVLYIYMYIFK